MSERELLERLERLETSNRRMKRSTLTAVVLAVALGGVYATRPVPNIIKTHAFELVDSSGNVRVAMDAGTRSIHESGITLYDNNGRGRIAIDVALNGTPEMVFADKQQTGRLVLDEEAGGPNITMYSPQHKPGVEITDYPPNPAIWIDDEQGDPREKMYMDWSGEPMMTIAGSKDKSGVKVGLSASGRPLVRITDAKGFQMDLGSTNTQTLATGETQHTSADSIIMFGNDRNHHVIWQAP